MSRAREWPRALRIGGPGSSCPPRPGVGQVVEGSREHDRVERRVAERRLHEVCPDEVTAVLRAAQHLHREVDADRVHEMSRRVTRSDPDVEDPPVHRGPDLAEPLRLVDPRVDSVVEGCQAVEELTRAARTQEERHSPPDGPRPLQAVPLGFLIDAQHHAGEEAEPPRRDARLVHEVRARVAAVAEAHGIVVRWACVLAGHATENVGRAGVEVWYI